MNKTTQNKPRHPVAKLLLTLIMVEIIMIVVLSLLKTIIPPIFYPAIREIAFWDIVLMIVTNIIYAIAFPNDIKDQKEDK